MPRVQSTKPDLSSRIPEPDRARGAALRLLAVRSRTVAELRERLGQRFQSEAVEQTLASLLDEGLLNDSDFAQQWRYSRERRKPRSRSMIERELKQRGIADDIISETLEDYDSLDAAYRASVRYAARQSGNDRPTFDRRVGAFLGRRGLEAGVIRHTLQRLHKELESRIAVSTGTSPD